MITGGVVFGALVAKVAAVLDKRNPQERAFNKKMYELRLFLTDVGVTMDIRDKAKVSSYFFHDIDDISMLQIAFNDVCINLFFCC
jgi:hypothetical protein